jgi:hypothetical protein
MGLDQEEGDEAHEQGVERNRLGQCKAEESDRQKITAELGLTSDRLDGLAEDVAHANARADCAQTGRETESQSLGCCDDVAFESHVAS